MTKNNLPLQLTPLVGREQEVAQVCALLERPDVRLLTLTGTGGIGKTRLSIQVATHMLASFSADVCFVSLSSLHDPDLVLPTIAQALGLSEASDWPLVERLKISLSEQSLLLLLDNFEQVVSAAPGLGALLVACPDLKILVTSRAVLHVHGECEFPVAPLAVPDARHLDRGKALAQYPAIALFLQRARSIQPDFQLSVANGRSIAEICTRLDGLPLAIELAAARIKLLPPQALLNRLKQSLRILTNPLQNVPSRQQTLRGTLTWSYELLNEHEQQLFRQLSVFVGGCTLEAAESICTTLLAERIPPFLDRITSLIDQSLLYQVEQETGESRLFLLATIRAYGLECLVDNGEAPLIQHTHATYYLSLAEEAEPGLMGAQQRNWLQRLEREHDNLRSALSWLLEQGAQEMALRLSGALWRLWWMTGQASEGRAFLERALKGSEQCEVLVRAKALNALGTLTGLQGNFVQSETLCAESLHLFRQQGDAQGIVTSLWMLGYASSEQSHYQVALQYLDEALTLARSSANTWGVAYSLELLAAIALDQGEYEHARLLIEESLALSRQSGDTWGTARTLWLQALVVLSLNDHVRAERLFQESLECSRQVKDKRGIGYALVMSGYVAFFQGAYTTMRTWIEEGLTLLREVGDRRGIAWGLYGLGWLALAEKSYAAAYALYEESLAILRELGHEWFIVLCLEGMAAATAALQRSLQAVHLWGYADARRKSAGVARPPIVHALYEQHVAAVQLKMGSAAFQDAWSKGQTMTIEQVLSVQMTPSTTPVVAASTSMRPSLAGLTVRECEVLRWVALGLTDNQVAEKLVISPRTVSTHLTSIYNKLNVTTRSAATRFAIEHHLT